MSITQSFWSSGTTGLKSSPRRVNRFVQPISDPGRRWRRSYVKGPKVSLGRIRNRLPRTTNPRAWIDLEVLNPKGERLSSWGGSPGGTPRGSRFGCVSSPVRFRPLPQNCWRTLKGGVQGGRPSSVEDTRKGGRPWRSRRPKR